MLRLIRYLVNSELHLQIGFAPAIDTSQSEKERAAGCPEVAAGRELQPFVPAYVGEHQMFTSADKLNVNPIFMLITRCDFEFF